MIRNARRYASLLILATTISSCSESSGPGVLPVLDHDPILFVHGYGGSSDNWDMMRSRFLADGWHDYELYAYTYSFLSSNATTAAEIRNQVNQIIQSTGATKVDIIAHSMGSISSRYYLKNLGGTTNIDAWVSLAGPNHGTDAAENQNCTFTPCQEILPGSTFLTSLNSVDETPGLVRYGTWRSPCDATINPDESVSLLGATNTLTDCIAHIAFLIDATVYQQVRDFVE
jgi:triacylglycerol lipase